MQTMEVCCLCGAEIEWWESHNPHPVKQGEDDRCCSQCNIMQVLPARAQEAKYQQCGHN